MLDQLRYLLLQVRNPDDPMRGHEVDCFASTLRCPPSRIRAVDLLRDRPGRAAFDDADIVLLGGSGDYSVAEGGPWMEFALDAMRGLHEMSKPTFASCWGFHAMAKAMGGDVVTDPARAEVGTLDVRLTPAGEQDPVFGSLPATFHAQAGHEDTVDPLPADAVLLAASDRANQAFRFAGKPIYCTQFHPELSRETLLDRLRAYPKYVEAITGLSYDVFVETRTHPSETGALLLRFVEEVMKT